MLGPSIIPQLTDGYIEFQLFAQRQILNDRGKVQTQLWTISKILLLIPALCYLLRYEQGCNRDPLSEFVKRSEEEETTSSSVVGELPGSGKTGKEEGERVR